MEERDSSSQFTHVKCCHCCFSTFQFGTISFKTHQYLSICVKQNFVGIKISWECSKLSPHADFLFTSTLRDMFYNQVICTVTRRSWFYHVTQSGRLEDHIGFTLFVVTFDDINHTILKEITILNMAGNGNIVGMNIWKTVKVRAPSRCLQISPSIFSLDTRGTTICSKIIAFISRLRFESQDWVSIRAREARSVPYDSTTSSTLRGSTT